MARLLLVDREPSACRTLLQILAADGHQVHAVPHGVEAVRHMNQAVPDLLLIDQEVPAGGLRTAELIHLQPRYRRVAILLGVQAGPQAEVQNLLRQGLRIGISGVLVRPYDPEGVRRKVNELCSHERDDSRRLIGGDRRDRTTEIRGQVRGLTELPTLSPAHQKIITIMSHNDDEIDVEALMQSIQSDQALTMRIMRIARSAYYGFQGNFIKTALTFLGMARVRQIVQSATILEVFDRQDTAKGGFDRRAAWMHSIACGMVMQLISRDNRQGRHFTAGLLHDVGKLVLSYRFCDFSRVIWETCSREQKAMHRVETDLLGVTHMEIGQDLANLWQLPSEVSEAIVHHHEPFRAYRHKYLSSLVYLADVAVRQMGLGAAGNGAPPVVDDPYAVRLHVDLEEVAAHRDELQRQLEAIISPEPA